MVRLLPSVSTRKGLAVPAAFALLVLAACATNPPQEVAAQNVDVMGEPYFATLRLSSGFSNDPRTVELTAGGSQSARDLGPGCRGDIASRPDVRLHYEAGSILPLNIYAESNEDITLAINRPDGSWICNDDYSGLNPAVLMDNPMSGQYDIFVGVYGGGNAPATLYVSELTPRFGGAAAQANNPPPGQIDSNAEPYYETMYLSSGFSNDPRTVTLQAGGARSASDLSPGCRGNIGGRPDVRVHYTAGSVLPLNIYAASTNADLTLVVRRPDGGFSCNDDYSGLNPAVLLNSPTSGQYDIWVGVYSGDMQTATLYVSELTPNFPR